MPSPNWRNYFEVLLDRRWKTAQDEGRCSKSNNCLLCRRTLEVKSKMKPTGCKHVFHTVCIEEWVQAGNMPDQRAKCPVCGPLHVTHVLSETPHLSHVAAAPKEIAKRPASVKVETRDKAAVKHAGAALRSKPSPRTEQPHRSPASASSSLPVSTASTSSSAATIKSGSEFSNT